MKASKLLRQPETQPKDPTIQVWARLSLTDYQRLAAHAATLGQSRAEVIESMICAALPKQETL